MGTFHKSIGFYTVQTLFLPLTEPAKPTPHTKLSSILDFQKNILYDL